MIRELVGLALFLGPSTVVLAWFLAQLDMAVIAVGLMVGIVVLVAQSIRMLQSPNGVAA